MSEGALLPVAPAVAAAVARRDRRRDPGPAALARAGLAGAPESRARRDGGRYPARPRARAAARGRRLARSSAARPRTSAMMARELGLPVPPGLRRSRPRPAGRSSPAAGPTASTTSCGRGWRRSRRRVGRRFGDAADPLLVSVRSGAPVSMPGMMDTILDLGLNDATERGPARPRPATRRSPRTAASGSRRCSARSSARRTCPTTRGSSSGWRSRPSSAPGTATAPGPIGGARAIPDDLGTARDRPGDGLRQPRRRLRRPASLFTRNPATGEPALYGDVLFDAQGEDVVAGTHATEPIAALDERLPAVAAELRDVRRPARAPLRRPVRHRVHGRARAGCGCSRSGSGSAARQAALRIAVDMAEDPSFPLSRREARRAGRAACSGRPADDRDRPQQLPPAARRPACGASPGVASGEIATSPEAAERAAEAGRAVDPRPRRDVARRRPRDGAGGRDPAPPAAGSRATPPSSPAAGASRRWSARRGSRSATARS